ncbi:MAG: hypothetical protein MUC29_13865 [Pyrinomonadaceae bacterium]|nr:hypothetical protein [Pyrinomonadaceae bacterium]
MLLQSTEIPHSANSANLFSSRKTSSTSSFVPGESVSHFVCRNWHVPQTWSRLSSSVPADSLKPKVQATSPGHRFESVVFSPKISKM